MYTNFNQLLVQNQLCLADVCQTVRSDATIDEIRLDWIFAGTNLLDELDNTKAEAGECANQATTFMTNMGSNIVAAWQNGARA